MPLIEIATFNDPMTAQFARGALEAAGIDAVLFDAGVSGTYAGALALAPARLMVDEADERNARAILDTAEG